MSVRRSAEDLLTRDGSLGAEEKRCESLTIRDTRSRGGIDWSQGLGDQSMYQIISRFRALRGPPTNGGVLPQSL